VVERCRNDGNPLEARFFPERTYFSATAVIRFGTTTGSSYPSKGPVLEFYNPVVARSLAGGDHQFPLAYDLSAPLAQMLEDAPRAYLAGFIDPGGASAAARLQMLEPYQPGKVPLVLIHGLYSDPLSWADLVNDLRATSGFDDKYQIWLYRYPTGQGFLQTAAVLRNELQAALAQCDPQRRDAALRRTVLVGHSMGGLIAKLQVTHSDNLVWKRLANRPLDEIVTTETTRGLLAETCYFEPSPDVSRVIFIASPHAGSLCSSALIGRGASLLVRPQPEQEAMHRQLIRDNPDTFIPEFEGRFPTSVDMLVPQSPLLETMRQMRMEPTVKLHNIIGVSHLVSLDGPSDGIVSARSASHPHCESVLLVDKPHAQVHRAQETSSEILRILAEHCRSHDVILRGQISPQKLENTDSALAPLPQAAAFSRPVR
jgi:pimeloyl-ACP methyl ester carboxylesterase